MCLRFLVYNTGEQNAYFIGIWGQGDETLRIKGLERGLARIYYSLNVSYNN